MCGCYKDLSRHRIASFSIESTRYCNYGRDKFDNQIKFIKPVNMKEGTTEYEFWRNCMEDIEESYLDMSKLGAKPDQLRMLLPHSTAAEVNMTCNIREWKHVLSLRCTKHAHPAINQLLIPLLLKFKEDMPEIFENIDYNTDMDPNDYAQLTIMKD